MGEYLRPEDVAEACLNGCYRMLEGSETSDSYAWMDLVGESTMFCRLAQNKLKLYKAFDIQIRDFRPELRFVWKAVNGSFTQLGLIASVEFKYIGLPDDIVFRMDNVHYKIMLRKKGKCWQIINITTDHPDFIAGWQHCVNCMKHSQLDWSKSVHQTFDMLDLQVDALAQPQFSARIVGEIGDTEDQRYVFSYNADNGIRYARKHALYSQLPEDKKLFYYASDDDCADFVSQCVWAAYGGYIDGDTAQNKKNIREKVRMVYTGSPATSWYGTGPGGGGTLKWESIVQFHDFAVSGKTNGPKGVGYGGGLQSGFDFKRVRPGNVLQFWPVIQGKWYHSVYVSAAPLSGNVGQMFVCQHSRDIRDRPLVELLNWNTNKGKLRGISFGAANFEK